MSIPWRRRDKSDTVSTLLSPFDICHFSPSFFHLSHRTGNGNLIHYPAEWPISMVCITSSRRDSLPKVAFSILRSVGGGHGQEGPKACAECPACLSAIPDEKPARAGPQIRMVKTICGHCKRKKILKQRWKRSVSTERFLDTMCKSQPADM